MSRPRYGNKKRQKSPTPPNGAHPPDRGHGTQERENQVEAEGANGRGRRRPRKPEDGEGPRRSLGERLGGTPRADRSSLLSQSDRRLIGELTEALRENSALLRGDQPEEVTQSPESGPRPVDAPQPEEQPEDTESPQSP